MNRRHLIFTTLAVGVGLASVGAEAQAQVTRRPGSGGRRQGQGLRRDRAGEGVSTAPHQTISTGADAIQAYDLYGADHEGPVLAFIHGGGWQHGDKAMVHSLPDYAQRHGLVLASIGYRLVPNVTPREQAQDIAAAIADLKRRYPRRDLLLMGHSAGAHLAALVGVDPQYLQPHRMTPSDLAGVILLDGAGYDATQDRGNGFAGRMLGNMYETAFGHQAAALSPTLLVRPDVGYPPFLIFYIASRQDSHGQSEGLAEALNRAGGRAVVLVDPDDSHRDINVEFGVAGDAEGERAWRFIQGD